MASEVAACNLAYEGKIEELRITINEKSDNAIAQDLSERMPLHWACSAGRADIVEYLVDDLKVPVDIQDDAGWTPLMIAVSAGHLNIVAILLRNNADIHICNYTGQSVLHYAASKNHYSIAESLLNHGIEPNVHDRTTGATPLHRASSRGNEEMVKLLIRNGSAVNSEDFHKNTPLHLACEEDRSNVVRILLEHGASLDTRNKDNLRPFDMTSSLIRKQLLGEVQ